MYKINEVDKVLNSNSEYPKYVKFFVDDVQSKQINITDSELEQIREVFNGNQSYINASKFAEHVKMLIDQERGLHDYIYNLAAELKAESRPMTLLRRALEDEFSRHTDHLTDNFVTDILSKVYSNSDFYYKLCLEIWNDERVTEIINEG